MVPVVVAHRTCPRHAVENSLEGIRAAGVLGADVVEIDVRPTRDGHAVLMHDRTMRRLTGARGPTRLRTLADVRGLRLPNGEPVPTFAEALGALPDGLRLAIDVKSPRAADAVLATIVAHGVEERVMVWSQHPSVLVATARRCPQVARALLRDTRTAIGDSMFLRAAVRCGATGISARWGRVTPPFVARARAAGLQLYAWCRTPEVPVYTLALLDGVVSDFPLETRLAVDGLTPGS